MVPKCTLEFQALLPGEEENGVDLAGLGSVSVENLHPTESIYIRLEKGRNGVFRLPVYPNSNRNFGLPLHVFDEGQPRMYIEVPKVKGMEAFVVKQLSSQQEG